MDPMLSTIATLLFLAVVVIVVLYLSRARRQPVRAPGRLPPRAHQPRAWSGSPGLRFLIPFIDRPVKVDLREQFIEIPSQTAITKDNAPINIDFLIYWQDRRPARERRERRDFAGALQGIATTTLRAVIGDILLDDVLSKREQVNEVLRAKLDEQTERWGGKVTTVEIREIVPPPHVQDAMNRMLSAERNRRAVITESEGERQSAINVAEGEKQSAILKAEGDRQAAILRGRGLQRGAQADLLGGQGHRRPHDGAAVPRRAQGAGRHGVDEVHHPARAHRPRASAWATSSTGGSRPAARCAWPRPGVGRSRPPRPDPRGAPALAARVGLRSGTRLPCASRVGAYASHPA